ncbi:MAG TPA: FecR domain-containing protein [Ohtaekwangia sp.]|uniref:FecR family protein n=1 Tax=Ohtaekwangia sp. TaxID=2066019 RepID=UPI002F91D1E5
MDSARLTYLFHRYINQTCTPEERQEFLELISQADYHAQVKDLMKGLWQTLQPEEVLPKDKAESILLDIFRAAPIEELSSTRNFFSWRKVAAAIILVIACAAVLYIYTKPSASALAVAPIDAPHQIINLPDGSRVILNARSTLEYPASFEDKSSREVTLTGEGYFDIQHDVTKPFIVYTGEVKTIVLGTAFNIKAYPDEKNITVTVTRGRVKVSDARNVIGIITPDQQITFNKEEQASQQQTVDSRTVVAWSDKDIFFDDSTLEEVAQQLEQRFHIRITFDAAQLKECRFTATFVSGESLDQILTVICEFNGSHFSRDDNGNILISGGGC